MLWFGHARADPWGEMLLLCQGLGAQEQREREGRMDAPVVG